MANVFLIGLEGRIALEISSAASVEQHRVFRRPYTIEMPELVRAGIIFAGGTPQARLAFLRRVRLSFPTMPFVIVAENIDTEDWLDVLEAGATDYCCSTMARREIQRLMESLVPIRLDGLTISLPRGGQRRNGARKHVLVDLISESRLEGILQPESSAPPSEAALQPTAMQWP